MNKDSFLSSIFLIACLQLVNFCQGLRGSSEESSRPLILVSTVDGKISALDTKNGLVKWSNSFGSSPLVSSSLTHLYYNQDGKDIEIVPSFRGNLFKKNGDSLEAIPFNAEDLLEKSQHHITSTSQLVGGKEYSSLGVDASTGSMLYNCSSSGCDQVKTGVVQGDVIVVKRNQLTIRLVESRSGAEKWNFKVSEINLDFSKGSEMSLLGYRPQRVEPSTFDDKTGKFRCKSDGVVFSDKDLKRIKFSIPEATIVMLASDDSNKVKWKHTFDSHIISAWVLLHGKLQMLNLFDPKLVPTLQAQTQDDPQVSAKYSMFQGDFRGQSFIHVSPGMQEYLYTVSQIDTQQKSSTGIIKHEKPEVMMKFYVRPSKRTRLLIGDESGQVKNDEKNNELQVYTKPKIGMKEDRFYFGNPVEIKKMIEDRSHNKQETSINHHFHVVDDVDQQSRNSDTVMNGNEDWLPLWFLNVVPSSISNYVDVKTAVLTFLACLAAVGSWLTCWKIPQENEESRKRKTCSTLLFDDKNLMSKTQSENDISKMSIQIPEKEFQSRFLQDFEVIECLGKGGFGIVFKARNKMDDCSYAVKRIQLPESKRSREKVLREVRALAKLDHRSIVRFYNAWDESPPPGWQQHQDHQIQHLWCKDTSSLSSPYTVTDSNMMQTRFERRQSSLKLRIPTTPTPNGGDRGDFRMKIETTDSEMSPSTPLGGANNPFFNHRYHHHRDNMVVTTTMMMSNGDYSADYNQNDDVTHTSSSSSDDEKESESWKRLDCEDDESSSMGIVFDSKAYAESNNAPYDDDVLIYTREKSSQSALPARKRSQSECEPHQLVMESEQTTKSDKYKKHRRTSSYNVRTKKSEQEERRRRRSNNRRRQSSTDDTTMYLYIQMQLCKRDSLRTWLELNRSSNRDHIECLSIFKQVADAVVYIHSSNLIHRDLKPSNVFFSLDGVVKVGDFGLVTKAKDDHLADVSYSPRRMSTMMGLTHTQQVGTQLYMAPEQMTSKRYTDKVDIFALGLILFELSNPFDTQMERVKLLNEARYGKFPESFPTEYPNEVELIGRMLNIDAHKRPSAVQVRDSPLFEKIK